MADDATTPAADSSAYQHEEPLPSAPPIFSNALKTQAKSKQCEPNVANCDRRLVHKGSSTIPKSSSPSTDLTGSGWRRSVVHNPRVRSRTHAAGTSAPPSSRSSRNVPGIIVRGRVFYLRLRVPRTLHEKVGRTHFWRSLGTSKWDEAVREARLVGAQFEAMLRQAEGRGLSPVRFAHDLRDVRETILPTVPAKVGKTLREVFELHQSDPSKTRTSKTVLAYENTFEVIGAVIDLDVLICDISRDDCRRLLETLRWVPSNPTKRYPKLSIVQAAEMAKRKKLTSTLNPATINAYLNRLSSVLNFAMNEGWIDRNPTRGLKVADPVRARDKRLPFSPQQLQRIFNAPLYRGCLNDEAGYATPGSNHPRRGRFWVPLIGLFSGMRLNEICQLDVADIQEIEGVPCFHVRPDPLNNKGGKRLKTEGSERLVPIHPTLVELGLLSYASDEEGRGGRKLFPELRLSTTGYYSDPFSKWFRRFLIRAGASGPRTCFHSFRHSFRDALRAAQVDHEVGLALGGWKGSKAGVSEHYGRGFSVSILSSSVAQISYPCLNLTGLRQP